MDIHLYNTASRKKEKFKSLNDKEVGLYTCGPTVYFYPQIGNWRTFVFEDILRRTLLYNGYLVNHVMNITDVGHLTGDNVGDADLGEDRMENAAKKEGKTAWEIADFYTKDFVDSREKLNILAPTHFVRATDHIAEQIALIQKLESKGLTYTTGMGLYFNVSKYPDYGKLSGQKMIDKRSSSREELKEDPDKKSPTDFALWKFSKPVDKRQMEWGSPWGTGFPGWHIECSAMSMRYLGETFDIHTGGVDHVAIHHTNEIAQSEGATGKLFAKYWLHGEFLKVDGGRMGKSLGNAYTIHDVIEKGFEPLALRYLYLTAHYRDTLNFTWESLKAAGIALNNLREQVLTSKNQTERTVLSPEKENKRLNFSADFNTYINDDLNTPKALAVLWSAMKSNIPSGDKYDLAMSFDEILGLSLSQTTNHELQITNELERLLGRRNKLRTAKKFDEADAVRKEIEKHGYMILDTPAGTKVKKI